MENTNTFWTLEWAHSYGHELVQARRFTESEKSRYAEWFRERGMVSIMGTSIKLPYITWEDNPKRKSDGAFNGCDNCAWTLTGEEVQHFIALNNSRRDAAQAKEQATKQAEDAKRAAIFAQAKQQNAPQKLDQWVSDGCVDRLEDCSFDVVVLLAMPDGTTKRQHTHCF